MNINGNFVLSLLFDELFNKVQFSEASEIIMKRKKKEYSLLNFVNGAS